MTEATGVVRGQHWLEEPDQLLKWILPALGRLIANQHL